MRGRGVDHPRAIVLDQRHGLASSVVGQAEDDEIGVVQRFPPRGRILAPTVVERDQRDFRPAGQSFANLEARGAGGTIYEDGRGQGCRLRTIGPWVAINAAMGARPTPVAPT